jgi:hypothetical protein
MSHVHTTSGFARALDTNAPFLDTQSIWIQAPVQKVWETLTTLEQWPAWLTNVSLVKMNGLLQAGTTFDWKTNGMTIHSTLHTVTPLVAIGWTGKVWGMFAVHNWEFREVDGQTEVTVSESMDGFLLKVFRKTFNKMLSKDMHDSLQLLKKACE